MSETLGMRFAQALAAKDRPGLEALLHPELDFRGMTPRRVWEATTPQACVDEVLSSWFADDDRIDAVEALDTDAFADRERVGYRFTITNPKGRWVVEQQAYISERDGRIGWMRVLCSGFRPL